MKDAFDVGCGAWAMIILLLLILIGVIIGLVFLKTIIHNLSIVPIPK